MKNMIITMGLMILFAMLCSFQCEINAKILQNY